MEKVNYSKIKKTILKKAKKIIHPLSKKDSSIRINYLLDEIANNTISLIKKEEYYSEKEVTYIIDSVLTWCVCICSDIERCNLTDYYYEAFINKIANKSYEIVTIALKNNTPNYQIELNLQIEIKLLLENIMGNYVAQGIISTFQAEEAKHSNTYRYKKNNIKENIEMEMKIRNFIILYLLLFVLNPVIIAYIKNISVLNSIGIGILISIVVGVLYKFFYEFCIFIQEKCLHNVWNKTTIIKEQIKDKDMLKKIENHEA